MTKLALAAAALAALLSTSALAQAPAADEGPVTRAQLEQMNKDRFAEMDANKDGFVTAEELGGAEGAGRAAGMVARLDSDKDGKVSLAELSARMLASFDFADSNKDGILTPQERSAARDAARARMQAAGQAAGKTPQPK
jgi:hypothetical protein